MSHEGRQGFECRDMKGRMTPHSLMYIHLDASVALIRTNEPKVSSSYRQVDKHQKVGRILDVLHSNRLDAAGRWKTLECSMWMTCKSNVMSVILASTQEA